MNNKGWVKCVKSNDHELFVPGVVYPVTGLPGEPDGVCGGTIGPCGTTVTSKCGKDCYLHLGNFKDAYSGVFGTFEYIPPMGGEKCE
ncbi:hypothetical protein X848_gp65 [Edwardsiella phage PEi21]|uniref:Uncharacterized protein n=1 Tax=Edwardsiella phage PEi21 TaxID=1325372 RepID=N0DPH2_9CAUD|nr:hypothetical protein X848_gp65 [Edwardsiella phage PEi21]BAN16875.1 hypothetical protein [Edwardsiella phage PEi21]